ncbi:MAG TPA: hypothetical protein VGO43_08175 [Pyrinomonadaceae bacterium]|jgi:hypothetical protein|nr:hypothetical protein [Pyrinomonadaceae bacterium]
MVKPTTWSIYSPDDHYLGQMNAFSPQAAFCEYMFVTGKEIPAQDVQLKMLPDNTQRIVYDSKEYPVVSR